MTEEMSLMFKRDRVRKDEIEIDMPTSVTRLDDLLDFGQFFKASSNNYFAQISHIVRQFLKRCQNLSFF